MTTLRTPQVPSFVHRPRVPFAPTVCALVLFGTGCGPIEYGPAVELDEVQRASLVDVTDIALASRAVFVGAAAPGELLQIHARMSRLAPAARPDGTDVSIDESALALRDASCASGSPSAGFDFDGCRLVVGSDRQLGGQILLREGELDFELHVPPESSAVAPSRLDGGLNLEGSRIAGELRYRIGSDGGAAGDPAGTWSVGGQGPHATVTLVLDATFDAEAGCLTAGTAEVRVSGDGGEDSVLYELASCGEARIRLERE